MIEYLTTPYRIKVFYSIAILCALVLAALYQFALPYYYCEPAPTAYEVLSDAILALFVAVFAAIGVISLQLWFFPPRSELQQTSIVRPPDRGRVIEKTRHDTDNWWFSGGLGRYTRAATLPELNAQAKRNNKTTIVTLHLLDPLSETACEAYADYRRSAWSSKHDSVTWTCRRVQLELVATVLAAAAYSFRSRLTINVRYRPSMTVFRVDLGDKGAIVTQEDTRMEALFFAPESGGYAGHREQLRIDDKHLRTAPLPLLECEVSEVTTQLINNAIANSELAKLEFNDEELTRLTEMVKSPKHPYS